MKYFLFVLAAVLIPSQVSAEGCETVISLSKQIRTTVSDRSAVQSHAAKFCSEYSRNIEHSKSIDASASYKFLAASFASSNASADAVASKYCSAENSASAIQDAYREYVELISPDAYGAYQACLRLAQEDVKFQVDLASVLPKELIVIASYLSRVNAAKTAKLTVSASDGISCQWLGHAVGDEAVIDTGTSVRVKCKRDSSNARGAITLNRADGTPDPLTLRWNAYDTDGHPVDTLAALQRSLDELKVQVTAEGRRTLSCKTEFSDIPEGQTNNAQKNNPVVVVRVPKTVPPGYVVTGGGCQQTGEKNQNAIQITSMPMPNGWRCAYGDPLGSAALVTVMAHAIYCRLSDQQ